MGIEPARTIVDPLKALGVVLLGLGQPVVLCAVDWSALRSDANLRWRQALVEAVHTVPERVAGHCIHQHDAPFADVEAARLTAAHAGAPSCLNLRFFDRVVRQCATAAGASPRRTSPMTHVGIGQGHGRQVAANRRIIGPDGWA